MNHSAISICSTWVILYDFYDEAACMKQGRFMMKNEFHGMNP